MSYSNATDFFDALSDSNGVIDLDKLHSADFARVAYNFTILRGYTQDLIAQSIIGQIDDFVAADALDPDLLTALNNTYL